MQPKYPKAKKEKNLQKYNDKEGKKKLKKKQRVKIKKIK